MARIRERTIVGPSLPRQIAIEALWSGRIRYQTGPRHGQELADARARMHGLDAEVARGTRQPDTLRLLHRL